MLRPVAELFEFRQLLFALVARDLRVRYKRSVLGVLWAFLEPLALMTLLTTVFSFLLRVPVARYPAFALSGVIVWTFFHTGVTYALSAVSQNAALVKKIYFPREILPLATVAGRGVHFALSLLLLAPFVVYFHIDVGASLLWLPALVVVQLMLIAGLALLFGALATLYEDAGFIVNFAFSGLFYLSPVFYSVEMVPAPWRGVYLLNPMAALLDSYRAVLLENHAPAAGPLLVATLVSLTTLVAGLLVFRRLAWRFAEVL